VCVWGGLTLYYNLANMSDRSVHQFCLQTQLFHWNKNKTTYTDLLMRQQTI